MNIKSCLNKASLDCSSLAFANFNLRFIASAQIKHLQFESISLSDNKFVIKLSVATPLKASKTNF
jgi:hypothetical protein